MVPRGAAGAKYLILLWQAILKIRPFRASSLTSWVWNEK